MFESYFFAQVCSVCIAYSGCGFMILDVSCLSLFLQFYFTCCFVVDFSAVHILLNHCLHDLTFEETYYT